jgi:hypothetical protein
MTERDAFEIRFGAAVHGYAGRVSSGLDPVEFAHRIATSEPRRHTLAATLGWHGVAIPPRTWVLLLLAALLTALVAGMLVVGSRPDRKLPAVVPPNGQLFVCPPGSTPDKPGPVDHARPLDLAWTPHMAFDRRAGRVVAVTGSAYGPAPETWTFDVCTNTWTQMHPNREPPGFVHSYLVYDVDSDVTIGVPHPDDLLSGKVWAYDLQANTWTEKGAAKGEPRLYDPVSGLVVAEAEGGLLDYDVETDTWTPIYEASGEPQPRTLSAGGWSAYGLLAYDASVDRIVALAGSETRLFDLRTGTWSRPGVDAPVFIEGFWWVPAVAYDETAERTVFLGNVRWAAYDAAADRWESLGGRSSLPGPMVYDAVNRRLVNIELGGRVVAFDPASREWSVLLEASEGRPAPSSE